MWVLWIELAMLTVLVIGYPLYTIVFWFWFIYLVDAMKRKRGYYKTALRSIEVESDPQQQMLAHSAKTEFVKYVYLFCLNLVDWTGFTTASTLYILQFVWSYQEIPTDYLPFGSGKWNYKLHVPYFYNLCLVSSMAILGSMCMYLSARYAQKSWIKSTRIPCCIFFFSLSSIASQILITICYTYIIGIWCDKILVTVSVIFAWKQYRKLNMVIQWSIVDLRVKGDIELLEKHIKMKRRFNKILSTIWIGVFCVLIANFICLISHTTQFILLMHNHSLTDMLHCPPMLEKDTETIVYCIAEFMAIIGLLFFFIPYTGYGLCTMFVLLWRLFKGKTGYRTHFHVHLTEPLIQP